MERAGRASRNILALNRDLSRSFHGGAPGVAAFGGGEAMIGNNGSKILWVLVAGAMAAAALPGAACAADGTIKIGTVLPITGKESKIGGAYKQATEFAVKEVNDAGGVNVGGKPMKMEVTA